MFLCYVKNTEHQHVIITLSRDYRENDCSYTYL
jgi:hypothetical protein